VIAGAMGHACMVDDARGYRELLEGSIEWLRARGVQAEGYLTSGNIIEQIVAHANRLSIDLVVLGHYPQRSGGFWWSGPQRGTLAERLSCCLFVAVSAETSP
jgi:nucleotide-binding universal stress UspA family protein